MKNWKLYLFILTVVLLFAYNFIVVNKKLDTFIEKEKQVQALSSYIEIQNVAIYELTNRNNTLEQQIEFLKKELEKNKKRTF